MYTCLYIYTYIYIYIYVVLICISADLSKSVERVRLLTIPLANMLTAMQPKQQSSKAARQPGSKAAGQQGSKAAGIQDLAVDFKIWQLTSYLSLDRDHSSLPNRAPGCRTSAPFPPGTHQISPNQCCRPHGNAK